MMYRTAALLFLWFALPTDCSGCECIGAQRPCEYLRGDVVFVGSVIATVPETQTVKNLKWVLRYSMQFKVEESLRGNLGDEVTIWTGNGTGDCGTPLPAGQRILLFAYKKEDGQLWTGMCSGNLTLTERPADQEIVDGYRDLIQGGVGSIFGRVLKTKPIWKEHSLRNQFDPQPVQNVALRVQGGTFSAATKTAPDGSYSFEGLPSGAYTVVLETPKGSDYDREDEDRYGAELSTGQCESIGFLLEPISRIRGHVTLPHGFEQKSVQIFAIPVHWLQVRSFEGKWSLADENGRFDLWPLPPGDYFVGVNINSSPSAEAPFPPTFYPGVTSQPRARAVHLAEGEVKEIELPVLELAKPRLVHFVAIGLDGKPMRSIYIQLEDLRHPGDASSDVNVDLDSNGEGTVTVYAGYSYHLHGSRWMGVRDDWCAKPVVIPAGTEPVEARFVMDRRSDSCFVSDIDKGLQ